MFSSSTLPSAHRLRHALMTILAMVLLSVPIGLTAAGCDGDDDGDGDPSVADTGGDVSTDVSNNDALLPPACPQAERRCQGQTAQQCIAGAWQNLFECPAGKVCADGACTDGCSCQGRQCGDDGCGNSCGDCLGGGSCTTSGQCEAGACDCNGAACGTDNCGNSCGTCPTGFSCTSGQCQTDTTCSCSGAVCGDDGCGNSCGTCPSGSTCQAGHCGVSSVQTCGDVFGCVVDNCLDVPQELFDQCQSTCLVGADALATSEYNNYLACIQSCGSDDLCFANTCSGNQAACFFDDTGFSGCFDILDCMDLCADGDDSCVFGCYESSTFAAQTALLALNNCISAVCPDSSSGDTCIDTALEGSCATHLNTCYAN